MRARIIAVAWALLIGVLAALAWLRFFHDLNADELWAQALLGDLRDGGVPLRWMLPPANGLFPGVLLAGLGFAVGLDDVPYYMFYSAAISVLLLLATAFVLRRAGLEPSRAWPAAALSVVLTYLLVPYNVLSHMLFLPGSHGGVLPIALICFALSSRPAEIATPGALSLFFLVSLTAFSDLLVLPQIAMPILATMLVVAWQQPPLRRAAMRIILITTAAACLGAGLFAQVGRSGILDHGPIAGVDLTNFAALRTFVLTFLELVAWIGVWHMIGVVLGLGIGAQASLRALLQGRPAACLPIMLMTLSSLAGLLGPILAGSYIGPAIYRQQLPLYTMPIILLIWGVYRMFRLGGRVLAPAAVALCAALSAQAAVDAWHGSFVINRRLVRAAERIAELPVDLTMALYWEAKPTYLASGRRLLVCPVVEAGSVYNWIANYGWCTEGLRRWTTHRNWLAVNSTQLEGGEMRDHADALMAKFGAPDDEVELEGRRILLYQWNSEREARVRSVICGAVGRFRPAPPC